MRIKFSEDGDIFKMSDVGPRDSCLAVDCGRNFKMFELWPEREDACFSKWGEGGNMNRNISDLEWANLYI